MFYFALQMLIGDRAKYIGMIIGLTFASLLITQQSAIFAGIMARTYSFLTDVGLPDIWVVDPQAQFVEDIKPLQDTEVLRVRGVKGVQWAVPIYKGTLRARLSNGTFQSCIAIGLDDETMIVMLLEDMLADLGCTVAGSAGSVAQSLAVIQRNELTLDGAFLDINLRGELVYPVADALKARGVPFVFVTGNTVYGIDPGYAGVPALPKPFGPHAIEQAVKLFAERRRVPAIV